MVGYFYWVDVVVFFYEIGWNSGVFVLVMGFGKFVVVICVGGFDEVVENGVNGLLVEFKDLVVFVEVLMNVIIDSDL